MSNWHRRPLTDLEKALGHRVSEQEQAYFDKDVGKKGYTLFGHNYEGPGNSLNNGKPVDNSDDFARVHDYQYFDTQWRYNEGELTQEQAENEIRKEDREAISGFEYEESHGERLAGLAGALGLGIKNQFENVFGHKYPDFPDAPHKHPYIETDKESRVANEDEVENDEFMKSVAKRPGEITPPKPKRTKVAPSTPTSNNTIPQASLPEASGGETSAQSEVVPEDIEMATLTGTGKEQSSGGASSDGMIVHYIEKPLSVFGAKTSTYRKCHKFMTFGLAPAFCKGATADDAQDNIWLTSYLAEVPWHIPALYLNQSEFDLIPNGSKIVQVKIDVVYRGSTIQFETNATATGLATLNQINDIAVAHGLNRTGWGSNVKFTAFDGNQPMIPRDVARPQYGPNGVYRGMVRDYYGTNNDVAGTAGFADNVPKHQVGRQTFLYNYFAQSARSGLQTGANAGFKQFGGWPCLAEKITQIDGKTVVNKVVASSTYKPKMAPIKPPLKAAGHGLPFPAQNATMDVPGVGNLVAFRTAQIRQANTAPSASAGILTETTETSSSLANNTVPTFDIYTPIEKSQYMTTGYWNLPEGHIQPSIHIGVQPVPALSTASTLGQDAQFNSWTDTRAYWEVIATMVVEEHQPTAWPFATQPNVPFGDVINYAPVNQRPAALTNPRNDGATFAGLYTTSTPSLNI